MTTATEHLLRTGNVLYLDQYFGIWAMQDGPFLAAVCRAETLDLKAHLESQQAAGGRGAGFGRSGNVAVIEIFGTLMKQVSSFGGGTSTIEARRQIRAAMADDEIAAILLHVDSPGGTIAGTKELADDVAAAAKQKPLHAFIEDLGASAALWVASQAAQVFANETAMVGSIGTLSVIHDLSAMAAKEGIQVHVISTGTFKGAGTPGTIITAEQIAEWQRLVNQMNEFFIGAVAAGRKLTIARTRELADGRLHIARDAVKLGLIDGIQTFEQTVAVNLEAGRPAALAQRFGALC